MKPFVFVVLALAAVAPAGPARALESDPLASVLAAEFALQSGDIESAASAYAAAAEAVDDGALAERAARIAFAAGNDAAAARALRRWQDVAGDAPARTQLEVLLALRRDDVDAAADATRRLLGDGEEGWQRAVQALSGAEDKAQVADLLAGLLDDDALPDMAEAWFAFGALAARIERPELEARLAESAAERFPDSARVWLWQAQRRRADDDMAAAAVAVDRARALAGDDTGLRLGIAAELDAQGKPGEAAAALAEGEQNELVRAGRVAYLARAEDDAALAAMYEELQIVPEGEEPPAYLLGQLAELMERHEDALAWYQRVGDPQHAGRAVLRAAVALDKLDRLDDGIARLRSLQVSEENDGELIRDAYLLEAELLMGRDRLDDAIAAYDRGLAIFEDDPALLYARALAYERADRVDDAEADLRTLVEMDPENADALNALGYTLADRTTRYDEALGYIQRAIALAPDSPAIVDSLGWVLYRMGRTDEALEHLRRAFELLPDAEIAAHLGEVLWESGRPDEARRIWRQGLELDDGNRALRRTMERYGE